MIKIIAIGNLLMCDDGVAIKVIDYIKANIEKLDLGIECIEAETDINFALDSVENGDFIFIIDSTLIGLKCGQITQISLEKVDKYFKNSFSSHNMSLPLALNSLRINVNGIIIGIEVNKVEFGLGISKELKKRFNEVCNEIYEIIKKRSLEYIEGKRE
ncbi:hydrogenase maturation protease [Clostridium sp. SHJSY1]|uniref:hydrogenase maturation protease n=1 Tax=Clostridium sp. SHJSY1 TaxID=2942483 RepID=UPI0028743C04|nr:hydrogenase maturation protease [Clostridium sp. SHJSY1]MDS0527797.1 hydrogenase maturation protease [Clostridium sp. SHJSY1]